MCHLYVMSDSGAGSHNGGSQQGHSGDWLLDQSGVKVGEVKVGADEDEGFVLQYLDTPAGEWNPDFVDLS